MPKPFVPTRPNAAPRPIEPGVDAPHRAARPGCRYCGQPLPEGRDVQFCPHCGQNLRVRRCAACSAELEPAWKFCVACGRASTP
ncbi:MAG: zinc ribbon domain-containing protein [Gemmatimonadetes bacterium]|nr:zinc ribbon domain-containing protein [Gemmatimonadota bacterium]